MHALKISLMVIVYMTFFTTQLVAQKVELGAGLGFGTQIKAVSYNFRAFYQLRNGIQIGPDFHFSFKNHGSDEFIDYALKRKEYGIQAKYVLEGFDLVSRTKFYPIIGFSLINLKFSGASNFSDNPLFEVEDNRDVFVGGYGGLGAAYELHKKISLYGELRYHASKEPQVVFNAGIVYPVNLPFTKAK